MSGLVKSRRNATYALYFEDGGKNTNSYDGKREDLRMRSAVMSNMIAAGLRRSYIFIQKSCFVCDLFSFFLVIL